MPSYHPFHRAPAHASDDVKFDLEASRSDLEILSSNLDTVSAAKLKLVNEAINEIGFTSYHLKLFFLNGFGYAVDSLVLIVQSVISPSAARELHPRMKTGLTIALYIGLLVGALFWGFSADIISRRFAFSFSLLICSVFAILAGFTTNWVVLGTMVFLSSFGAGGNLVLDTTIFLDYLPTNQQWLVILMAAWWGVGQMVTGLISWIFMPRWTCPDSAPVCLPSQNKGWRYVWFTSGSIVFILWIMRIFIVQLKKYPAPRLLCCHGDDEGAVAVLQAFAAKYNRRCSLTLEQLKVIDAMEQRQSRDSTSLGPNPDHHSTAHPAKFVHRFLYLWRTHIVTHVRGLFASRKASQSTLLIWATWLLIGLAYPLFNIFLPSYLKSRNAVNENPSPSVVWRDYAISNFFGVLGPILASFMANSRRFWGRRGTMIIGALTTCALFFGYTQVRNHAQNFAMTCTINFSLNLYYSTLFAYTPEVFPSIHRGTGNGIAIALNRVMGALSAVIAAVANTATTAPLYICASLFVVMAFITVLYPYESMGRHGC